MMAVESVVRMVVESVFQSVAMMVGDLGDSMAAEKAVYLAELSAVLMAGTMAP